MPRDIFSVSRLNMEVRAALEGSFPLLWVTGELSNLAQPRSGHLYFTLKDPGAQVRCALFRSRRTKLRFQPADGMQVVLRARVTLFEPRGDFQLVVEHMEPAGEGLLRQQIEALKARLAAEGLFDEAAKRPLPPHPARIGVITSPSGAAIRDVLTVLRRRNPAIDVVVYPVPVQGDSAAREIRHMIEVADRRAECDLLILTRGGGSLEDLMAFNDEGVVRAIHACTLPIISAVGHEIDITLGDFAADRRAPTPSAAAELATPDVAELTARLAHHTAALRRALVVRLRQRQLSLRGAEARLRQLHPGRRLMQQQQRLDELEQRLERVVRQGLGRLRIQLAQWRDRLDVQHPRRRLRDGRERLRGIELRLTHAAAQQIRGARQRAAGLTRQLHAVSPLATLGRGYAIVRRPEDGSVVTRASSVSQGEEVENLLAEGRLLCRVEAVLDGDSD